MFIDALLNANGICSTESPHSTGEIAALNSAVDALFCERSEARRSYVHVDEMQDLGIFDIVLNQNMRDIFFSIMPDPVIYHCVMVETAGNDPEPNLFAERLSGWHRDRDCSFTTKEPTHVSIFTYLSDVGDDDGAFEFVPQNPNALLRATTPSVLVTGGMGYTFAWQRSYYHRASPNRGPRRRRLLKFSIQRNAFPSVHLKNPNFKKTIERLPTGDPALDLLFGRYQGTKAPVVIPSLRRGAAAIAATGRLSIPDAALTKAQMRAKAGMAKDQIRAFLGRSGLGIAYD